MTCEQCGSHRITSLRARSVGGKVLRIATRKDWVECRACGWRWHVAAGGGTSGRDWAFWFAALALTVLGGALVVMAR